MSFRRNLFTMQHNAQFVKGCLLHDMLLGRQAIKRQNDSGQNNSKPFSEHIFTINQP
jgi:hypothetical protein